jgi:hypothetical protein
MRVLSPSTLEATSFLMSKAQSMRAHDSNKVLFGEAHPCHLLQNGFLSLMWVWKSALRGDH